MTTTDRLRRIADALPSDNSSVTLTREDILALLEDCPEPTAPRDLTVDEVAERVQRSASSVRGWLANGDLRGYKLRGRSWRVPPSALRAFLEAQSAHPSDTPHESDGEEVDITAWRRLRTGVDG